MSEPINDYQWYYGLGPDPERFKGGFPTHAAALAAGLLACGEDDEIITIVEARSAVIDAGIFDATRVMDNLREHNEDVADEDGDLGLGERTLAQDRELERNLTTVLETWLNVHKIGRVHAFADTRSTMAVSVPRRKEVEGGK